MTSELYEADYYEWTEEMAQAIRYGQNVSREDQLLLAEEIEDLGKAELSKLESAVEQLYIHLLKQRHQPEKQVTGSSWQNSINKQRFKIARLLKRNPSFSRYLRESDQATEFLADAYQAAVFEAIEQTGLPAERFDTENPFTYADFGLPPLTNKSGRQ